MASKKSNEQIVRDRQWYVAKSNDLIQRSRYSLPLQHQRVLLYIISRIKPQDLPDQTFTFEVTDFCQIAGINCDSTGVYYRYIKEIVSDLGNSFGFITQKDEQGRLYERPFTWLSHDKTKIYPGSGTITVGFSSAVQPYLFDLQTRYTKYRLGEVLPFKSKYSIRLYELLHSFAFGKDFDNAQQIEVSFDPEDLKIRLDADKKIIGYDAKGKEITKPIFSRYYDFKVNVINTAVDEINRFSQDFHVRYKEIRQGKKAIQIVFYVSYAHARQVFEARQNRSERLDK